MSRSYPRTIKLEFPGGGGPERRSFKSSPGDSNVQWGLRITDWDHAKRDPNPSRLKNVLLQLLYNYCLETFGLWNYLSSLTYNVSKPEMDLNLSRLWGLVYLFGNLLLWGSAKNISVKILLQQQNEKGKSILQELWFDSYNTQTKLCLWNRQIYPWNNLWLQRHLAVTLNVLTF